MKRIFLSLAILSLGLAVTAQEDKVLMTIDGQPIKTSEFLYIYEKNSQENTIEKKNMDEYLDLFINFKLKVREAKNQGIDTTTAFTKELASYRAQATPKYLKDQEAIDSLIRVSYDRMSRDRRAAHIAIQCPMNADTPTVETALAKINHIRERVTVGLQNRMMRGGRPVKARKPEDFFVVAKTESTDPTAAENSGELGWITPFRYVYAFENAVYSTPVGKITPVFRTAYGFHIALVEEERPHEEVHAAHIMKMVPRGDEEQNAVAAMVIDSLYKVVQGGAEFAEVAMENSDDKGSAIRGGDLGWFGLGYMVKTFEDAAFSLKDSGEVCAPFKSDFGWHFIQMKGRRTLQPFEELKESIAQRVQRDERMKEAAASFIRKTRIEYNLSDTLSDEEVHAYADAHLEEKYQFRNLVQEYHDGILLFNVSLKEVWDKASQDTEGLNQFFNTHKTNYKWEKPHFKGVIAYCKDASTEKAIRTIIKNCHPDSIESLINRRINISDSITYAKVQSGLWVEGQNEIVDKLGFKLKKATFTTDEEFPRVFVIGHKQKNPEVYTDERGKVTSDYQDYLEKEWIKKLREKYPVSVDKEVFESLKK